MEKKNTMLLTVIAVATLLVAVVGATFAYFSVTGTNDFKTTTITTTTEAVGTVALTNPTTEGLHLTITAADMALLKAGTPYYATTGSANYVTETEEIVDVAVATVTGGEADTKYKCEFDITVTVEGDMAELLQTNDAKIVFSGALEQEYDLSGGTKTFDVTMNTLTGSNTEEKVSAYVVFNNRADVKEGETVTTSGNQNYLANKTLTVTVANSEFACDTVE